jgi:hypothetical protein
MVRTLDVLFKKEASWSAPAPINFLGLTYSIADSVATKNAEVWRLWRFDIVCGG